MLASSGSKCVYLLRHGQSIVNAQGLLSGGYDDPLTDCGRLQAGRIADMIARSGLSFTHCFASPWRRARETADMAVPEGKYVIDARLGEAYAGEAAQLTWTEAARMFPHVVGNFGYDWSFPGGESRRAVFERVTEWFEEVDRGTDDDAVILAVSHAGPIDCLFQYICGIDPRAFPFFYPQNAGLSAMAREGREYLHGNRGGWVVRLFSATHDDRRL